MLLLFGLLPLCTASNVGAQASATWLSWASAHGVSAPKLTVCDPQPDERGKGGVFAAEDINAMEVIASVPRSLVLRPTDDARDMAAKAKDPSWATELTAAALMTMHPQVGTNWASDSALLAQKAWIDEWRNGGWATDSSDL